MFAVLIFLDGCNNILQLLAWIRFVLIDSIFCESLSAKLQKIILLSAHVFNRGFALHLSGYILSLRRLRMEALVVANGEKKSSICQYQGFRSHPQHNNGSAAITCSDAWQWYFGYKRRLIAMVAWLSCIYSPQESIRMTLDSKKFAVVGSCRSPCQIFICTFSHWPLTMRHTSRTGRAHIR